MTVKWITRVLAIVALACVPALTGCSPAEDGNNEANTEEAANNENAANDGGDE